MRIFWTTEEKLKLAAEYVRLSSVLPKESRIDHFNRAQQCLPEARRREIPTISIVWGWLKPLLESAQVNQQLEVAPRPVEQVVEKAKAMLHEAGRDQVQQVLNVIEGQAQREHVIKTLTLSEIAGVFASLVMDHIAQGAHARTQDTAPRAAPAPAPAAPLKTESTFGRDVEGGRLVTSSLGQPAPPPPPVRTPKVLVVGLHRNYRSELATRAMGRYDVTQVEDDQEIQQLDYDHIFICGTATDEFREAMQKHYGTTKVTTHAGDFTSLMSALRDLKQRINQGDRR